VWLDFGVLEEFLGMRILATFLHRTRKEALQIKIRNDALSKINNLQTHSRFELGLFDGHFGFCLFSRSNQA